MTDERNQLDIEIADAIIELPYPFTVGHRQFFLYPVTLGKIYILQRQYDNLGFNKNANPNIEMLRIAREKRTDCCTIIAYHTCKNKQEVNSPKIIAERRNLFDKEATDEDIATIMIMLLTKDKFAKYLKHLGIEKEQQRIQKVIDIKSRSDKNSLSFGGKSLYGSFIHPLLEIGMTWDEIVWERSYVNLRLLLADKVTSMYITDDERKKIPAWVLQNNNSIIKADDPKNKELIKSMDWR